MENRFCFKRAIRCLAVASFALLAPQAQADIATSFTGTFALDDNTKPITFTLTHTSLVTLNSLGFGGGTNIMGAVIPGGGFDTILTLFSGPAAAGVALAQNDDGFHPGIGVTPDALLQLILGAGTYTAVLTQFDNFWDDGLQKFSEEGNGNFTVVGCGVGPFCGQTANYAVDLVAAAPEPASIALMALGLVGFGVARKRKSA